MLFARMVLLVIIGYYGFLHGYSSYGLAGGAVSLLTILISFLILAYFRYKDSQMINKSRHVNHEIKGGVTYDSVSELISLGRGSEDKTIVTYSSIKELGFSDLIALELNREIKEAGYIIAVKFFVRKELPLDNYGDISRKNSSQYISSIRKFPPKTTERCYVKKEDKSHEHTVGFSGCIA